MALARVEAKIVSRGSGHSAVAKAAYNARDTLDNERLNKVEDYSRKKESDLLFEGFYPTKDAPEWATDRESFWNAVERREKRKDAQLGREFVCALPHELTLEQNRRLVQDWVRENFVRDGFVADVAIHAPHREGDERNIHAHVFVPLRRIEGGDWADKKDRRSKDEQRDELNGLRQSWEKTVNRALERYGHEARIDMRSYAEQGIERVPGVHLGKEATAMERRGINSELGNRNRAAANDNAELAELIELAELAEKQREGLRRQDEERAAAMWDEGYTSTLDGIRQRESRDRNSMAGQAKRALDDLAAVDPIGTARHFGHHVGDQLRPHEQARAAWAQNLRDLAPRDPEPVRDPQPEKTPPRSSAPENAPEPPQPQQGPHWRANSEGWDGLDDRQRKQALRSYQAWQERRRENDQRASFTVEQYVDYVQDAEADKRRQAEKQRTRDQAPKPEPQKPQKTPVQAPERAEGMELHPKEPEPAQAPANGPSVDFLRAALVTGRQHVAALGARLEAAFTRIMERVAAADERQRVDQAAHQAPPKEQPQREAPPRAPEPEPPPLKPSSAASIFGKEIDQAEDEAAAERLRRSLDRTNGKGFGRSI
jgi:hypothetical protein